MYPELRKYESIRKVRDLSVASFGTGMGYYDLCYNGLSVNAFNFALTTQGLEFDYKLMRHYREKFSKGCKMLLVLPYFIFCADDMPKYRGINERYYSILPEEDVAPRCNSTRTEYARSSAGQTEAERTRHLELTVPLTEKQMGAQICDALQDWLCSLHIVSFHSGELSPEVKLGIQASKQWLGKIFDFCQTEELDPVVVVPPLSRTLLAEIGQAFRDTHFYGPLEEVIGRRDVPVLDYTKDPGFCDPALFGWPGFLVKSAAKEFTIDVLRRIGVDV